MILSIGGYSGIQPDKKISEQFPIEIVDKSGEIILGFDGKRIYMIISDASLQRLNNQLLVDYHRDLQTFTDSNGSFIPGDTHLIASERIEYKLEDLIITLDPEGEIRFEYLQPGPVLFEQVMLPNGNSALHSFDQEDLTTLYAAISEVE